jgi:hypothetical protein
MKKLIFLLLYIPLTSFGQINFQKVPKDFQLFPRDENNNSLVVFSGNISKDSDDLKLTLKVFKDDILINEKSLDIIDNKFKSSSVIKAGLYQYKFELYKIVGSDESLLYKARNIVSGDAYIITGQSNSHASSKKSIYSSLFTRSFGVKT